MRLRSRNPKATVAGTAGSALGGIWGAYAIFATASQLPADARKLGTLLADPPIWLPWSILLFSVLVLAWSLWPSEDDDDGDPSYSETTSGPQSPIIKGGSGNVYNFAATPPAPAFQERKQAGPSLRTPLPSKPYRPPGDMALKEVVERVWAKLEPLSRYVEEAALVRREREVHHEIIDGIAAHNLTVWGRRKDGQPIEPIWRDALQRGTLSILKGEVKYRSPDNNGLVRWHDLKFNRNEVYAWLPSGW